MPESNIIRVYDGSAAILRKDEENAELQDTKTTYVLARATPLSGLKRIFTVKPKLIFQLQELSCRTRPRPVIDVLASNTFSTKLSQEFWSTSGRRRMWGGREFILLKSENYSASDDVSRETLAIIVDHEKDYERAEICLAGGHRWKATWLPNGVFEFVREDWNLNELSTVAWKPIGSSGYDKDLVRTTSTNDSIQQQKPTFSFAYSWHHHQPVLASLTPRHLDISADFSGASAIDHEYQSSITQLTSVSEELLDTSPALSTAAEEFDSLKVLIQITGLWVTLCLERCTNSSVYE
ncbi:hypothetical protein OIDMADRAFT_51069 [Oidiodendron maius Zn]|uniref:Uncharacterized protein n=1 Tax=Oidiodendron maius (strain Zn) TaxID=913774 RepID=A0A0C3DT49_OIDMZ|nr:hypothetical protein OIDMADRAFT_51069 [Oidiodendron maius Zn]